MRDQGAGGAMVFSSSLERAKLSVKVPSAAESGEMRRYGGYGRTYVATKTMQIGTSSSSIVPPTSASSAGTLRLKGGSASSNLGELPRHYQQASDSERLDLYHAGGMIKEYRGEMEASLEYRGEMEASLTWKRKSGASSSSPSPLPPAIQPPLLDDTSSIDALPQWGLHKRSRRSRFEASKPVSIARADGGVSKALLHHIDNDRGVKLPGERWSSRQANNTRGVEARNGDTRFNGGNALANHHSSSARHGVGKKLERVRAAAAEKTTEHKQRISNGSAEEPRQWDVGHIRTTHNRCSSGTDMAAGAMADPQTLEWPRILIGLSRMEKEEDFQKIKGPRCKLSQRPKKRPKVVERALHYCTPGNPLCDLAPGRYDVKEKKSVRKKPRGLKAMQSMESDSE